MFDCGEADNRLRALHPTPPALQLHLNRTPPQPSDPPPTNRSHAIKMAGHDPANPLFDTVSEDAFRAWERARSDGGCNMLDFPSLHPEVFSEEVVMAIITGGNYETLKRHYGAAKDAEPAKKGWFRHGSSDLFIYHPLPGLPTQQPDLSKLVKRAIDAPKQLESLAMSSNEFESRQVGKGLYEVVADTDAFVDECIVFLKTEVDEWPIAVSEEEVRNYLVSSILMWQYAAYKSGGPPSGGPACKKAKHSVDDEAAAV